MDDAALVRRHRFERDLPARAHRLLRNAPRKAAERLFALGAVIFTVHHDALVLVPADIRDRARKHLHRVEDLAAVPDDRIAVLGEDVDVHLFPFLRLGGRRDVHEREQPL